ncbi:MAG: methyltransferase domain-containing protein, partial [Alphaproteobacteria bacterium]
MTPDAFARLKPALACPRCKGPLDFAATRARCDACDRDYPIGDGQIRFVDAVPPADDLDSLKQRLKTFLGASYYTFFRPLLSPSYPFAFARLVGRRTDPEAGIAVDLGSGNVRRLAGLYTLDRVAYAEVDIVCDMRELPFRDGAVDAFVSNVVLEHVPEIGRVATEIARATRPGGRGIHVIPFLYPFHASPNDFQRYTHMGARRLFPGWLVAEQYPASGP